MGQTKAPIDHGELIEGDALEGDQLAALVTRLNPAFPPLVRINPVYVLPSMRVDIIAWASEAVRRGERLAVYRVADLGRNGAR